MLPPEERFTIEWVDHRREPQCAANPAYPHGIDIDDADGRQQGCVVPLPYPARRCGIYIVRCKDCGQSAGLTTAGRPDDPRSVKMACRRRLH